MTPEFEKAVGGMADIPNWFIWHLQWDAEEQKYIKQPWLDGRYPINAGDASKWRDYDTVAAEVRQLRANLVEGSPITYVMGFRLTEGCGYFLYDLDKCVKDDVPNELTQMQINAFPGAMLEFSSSRRGIHIIGMCSEIKHRSMFKELNWEFYTDNRGIAFGLDGKAWGCADTNCDAAVVPMVEKYFKPLPVNEGGQRALEWRGPEDDDELLARIYRASPSASVAFNGVVSTRQMMEGPVDTTSENDARLAATLAWWTGRDVDRIERLMRRSALYREKWDEYRPQGGSLLRHTILQSCAVVDTCYVERERVDTASALLQPSGVTQMVPIHCDDGAVGDTVYVADYVAADVLQAKDELLSKVSAAATEHDLYNVVLPAIKAAGVPPMFQDQIVKAFQRKLKMTWGSDTSVAKVRALLFPPVQAVTVDSVADLPDWAKDWCFVGNGDVFFNVTNSAMRTAFGFNAEFGRNMKLSDLGKRMNAAEQCLMFWNMPVVDEYGYRPDRQRFYDYNGKRFANTYSATSLPELAAPSERGTAGIQAFQQHLYDMCGRRQDVYEQVVYWIAHNVQKPGVKIRWSPIIKGTHGDGKGLLGEVIKAAMGPRNVNVTGNRALQAEFTDWAAGSAVNIIEEIHLTGKERHTIYNAMKEFITNRETSINPKGRTTYKTWNCTNHIAFTNHNDAIPLEVADRRWFVIFTPWADLDEMRRYCGLDEAGWLARTKLIEWCFENCAGELRNWLLNLPIPSTFRIDSMSVLTTERSKMLSSSRDTADMIAAGIIEGGMPGVCKDVVSTTALFAEMRLRALTDPFEIPQTTGVNFMMGRLGYSAHGKQIHWNGKLHRIWVRNGYVGDEHAMRRVLDGTIQAVGLERSPQR